jgi:hypothetical protein
MKFAIIFSVASLLLLPLARSADDATAPDELAIYKVLFTGKDTVVLTKPDPKAKPIELAPPDAKQDAEYSAWLKKELPGVEDATIADYRRRVLAPPLLTPNSEVGVKLVFVDQKTLDEIFRDGKDPEAGWTRFRERIHARGLTSVSRVGFNPGRTQALVFMNFSWASLGAEGYTILFERQDGKWTIKGQVMESAS